NFELRRLRRIAPPMERGSGEAPATATLAGRSRRCRLNRRTGAADASSMSLRSRRRLPPSRLAELLEAGDRRLQRVLEDDQIGLPGDVPDAAADVITKLLRRA